MPGSLVLKLFIFRRSLKILVSATLTDSYSNNMEVIKSSVLHIATPELN